MQGCRTSNSTTCATLLSKGVHPKFVQEFWGTPQSRSLRQILSHHTRHERSDKEGHGRRPVVAYCCPTAAKGSQRGYQSLSLLLVFPANDRLFLVGAAGLEPTLYGFYVRDTHLSPRVGSYREVSCLQVFRKSESANTCRCMPLRVGSVVVKIVVSSVPIQLRCPHQV